MASLIYQPNAIQFQPIKIRPQSLHSIAMPQLYKTDLI